MLRLKCEVLDRILLRRTKEGKSEDLVIPPKYIVLRKDPFDPFEADYYQAAYMSYEEEDTCMSYEEEDTCTSYETDYYQAAYTQSYYLLMCSLTTY
jgi:hypothetical protein